LWQSTKSVKRDRVISLNPFTTFSTSCIIIQLSTKNMTDKSAIANEDRRTLSEISPILLTATDINPKVKIHSLVPEHSDILNVEVE